MYYKNQFELTNALLKMHIPYLDKYEKSVLVHLVTYFKKDKDGYFRGSPSYPTLAKCTGIGRTKVQSSISKLEKLGIISSRMQWDSSKVYTWLGLSTIERAYNSEPKIKRTQEEWATYRKNANKVEALKAELDQIKNNMFEE